MAALGFRIEGEALTASALRNSAEKPARRAVFRDRAGLHIRNEEIARFVKRDAVGPVEAGGDGLADLLAGRSEDLDQVLLRVGSVETTVFGVKGEIGGLKENGCRYLVQEPAVRRKNGEYFASRYRVAGIGNPGISGPFLEDDAERVVEAFRDLVNTAGLVENLDLTELKILDPNIAYPYLAPAVDLEPVGL